MKYNIYARCDKECKSEHCDDYGVDYCADWHTEEEHQEGHIIGEEIRFCAKAAFLSDGCEICAEYWLIHRELSEGQKLLRICQECQYQFELNSENPYSEVFYDEGAGAVYFTCNECACADFDEDVTIDTFLAEDNFLDDTDGDYASWVCAACGDPAYDCGCGDPQASDVEDEIDRKAELIEIERLQ